jgi:hypothetical protein
VEKGEEKKKRRRRTAGLYGGRARAVVCYPARQKAIEGTHLGCSGSNWWRVSVWQVQSGETGVIVKVERANCTLSVLRVRHLNNRIDDPVMVLVESTIGQHVPA